MSFSGFLTRNYNLMDLPNEILLLIAQYLPDEDKIKLIDTVPNVESFVTTFKTNTRLGRKGLTTNELLKRLPNLRKVTTTTPGWSKEHKVLISIASINANLIKFDGFETQDILDYIERVKELDPSYDGSNVRKIFKYRLVDGILKRHLGLKLRLFVEMENEKDEDRFIRNGRSHLIHHLELQSGYSLRSPFPSVRELIVNPASSLSNNLSLLSHVTNVTLTPSRTVDSAAFQPLLRVEKLRKLNLFCTAETWTELNYKTFHQILIKPTLIQVVIKDHPKCKFDLIHPFLDCPRNDFKTFGIQSGSTFSVKVKKGIVTISKNVNFELIRLISKFRKIREIKIEIKNKKLIEKFRQEFNFITETIPRNRCLIMKIGNEIIRS